ncbi:MAG TPA: hypothetical protein VHG88_05850, partial [Burkholderiales bacterium]|nr:hypothetical protein [Burkholderiales bacterium]
VNTSWNVQGVGTEPGERFDLRFEYIDQDQPRAGSGKVGVGEIRKHHDEVRTVNRNWLATYDYTFSEDWGVSATLPVLDRSHAHIHNHMGARLDERWSFTEAGDLRVLARRQWRAESVEAQRLDFFGANFGLKLPSGKRDVRNAAGDLAERTLQPGTGTTDLLVGGYFRRMLGSGASWFVDGLLQQPLNARDDFRPGARLSFDLGYRWEWTEKAGLMLQLNYLHRRRDKGSAAEPEDSGGNALFASPGLSYALTSALQVYGFLQLPIYQYVNGVQLTADWALLAGLSARF